MPSTGSYSLDRNLNQTPERALIAIIGPTGSGKTVIANAIKSCFKKYCLIEDISREDILKQNFVDQRMIYDCVIVTHNIRKWEDSRNIGSSTKLDWSADYIFHTTKVQKSFIKVRCAKNRYHKPGDEFYLDLVYRNKQVIIEEV